LYPARLGTDDDVVARRTANALAELAADGGHTLAASIDRIAFRDT
jgi:hypothetical protein